MNDAATHITSQSEPDRISVELSSHRTGMSFQRTRMSADRTLMSVIRTSLSLIGFGFTIFQVFQKLYEAKILHRDQEPRNFGMALVLLGITMLVLGIIYHVRFMLGLRRERHKMKGRADSRREPISGVDDDDRRCSVASGRPAGDRQYGF